MEQLFVEMINTHRGIIYKVCNLYGLEQEDKNDLFQEVVLQLWKAFPSFRQESKPSTWMYRIALNTAITNFRKESRRPESKGISADEFQIPDLGTYSEENEQMSMLKQAIDALTEIEKAIILLYLEEKSYEEISEIIGISKTNVGVRINRIKIKLEKIIKRER
ncbi:ECF RNA polymerase sigma-E factor [compost metagenome]